MKTSNGTLFSEFGESDVSGWYEPGAVIAWWIQSASLALDICFKPEPSPPQKPDLRQTYRHIFAVAVHYLSPFLPVAAYAYISLQDLKEAPYDKRSTASFHAPIAILMQLNLIRCILMVLCCGKSIWVFFDIYKTNRHNDEYANAKADAAYINKLQIDRLLGPFAFRMAILCVLGAFIERDTSTVKRRDCSTPDGPSTSSFTCVENYANFLDAYVPMTSQSIDDFTITHDASYRAFAITTFAMSIFAFCVWFLYNIYLYEASGRGEGGWRARFRAVKPALFITNRVFNWWSYTGVMALLVVTMIPKVVTLIRQGQTQVLMPLTATSLHDPDQMGTVYLAGIGLINGQKEQLTQAWDLIEHVLFWGFARILALSRSFVTGFHHPATTMLNRPNKENSAHEPVHCNIPQDNVSTTLPRREQPESPIARPQKVYIRGRSQVIRWPKSELHNTPAAVRT